LVFRIGIGQARPLQSSVWSAVIVGIVVPPTGNT
jgi:hypothetical protein